MLRVREDLEQGEVQVGFTERLVANSIKSTEKAVRHFAENRLDDLPRTRSHQRAGNLLVGGLMGLIVGGHEGAQASGEGLRTLSG